MEEEIKEQKKINVVSSHSKRIKSNRVLPSTLRAFMIPFKSGALKT
jgi:hypothetical protein